MVEEKRNLPAIQDLYDEVALREKDNALNVLLNQPPKPDWIKEHPIVKKKVKGESVPATYLPIERIEYLLTRIFINWRVEIKNVQLIGNSVVTCVRLHYKSVTTGEWDWQDGVGASPLQTDKDAGAIEFNKLKSGAVMMAAPASESYAVKDAAEKLGKIFGKDLNRSDAIGYDILQGTFDTEEKALKQAQKKIIDAFETYTGKDKQALKDDCAERVAVKNFTWDYATKTAEKLGIKL